MSTISINKTKIPLGKKEHIKINVGSLPSGTIINLHVVVFRSKNPGPTLLVTGGVHGDEINGVEIIRSALEQKYFDNLEKGTVIAIPLLNVYGFINFSRETPDGKDVNRSFPGNLNGSLSSRVARSLTKEILPLIDYGLDFHTGGAARYNYPQVRYTAFHEKSKELALAFGAPITIGNTPIPKSWRKVAISKDKPVLIFEGGESLSYDGFTIQKGLEGINNILSHIGMIKANEKVSETIQINKTTWLRASKPGLFLWIKQSGQWVLENEPLGIIRDPYGMERTIIKAKKSGFIIGHNNAPVVSLGDPLFHIGYDWD